MKEKITFYKVSSYGESGYGLQKKDIISSLTESENIAKQQATETREVHYIHKHTLEVVKNFKIKDAPKVAKFHHFCQYAECPLEAIKDSNNGQRPFCSLHTALHWRNMRTKGCIDDQMIIKMKKIPQKKGEALLKDIVRLEQMGSSSYGTEEDKEILVDDLVAELKTIGIDHKPHYDKTPQPILCYRDNSVNVRTLAYIIIEKGGLKL